MGAAKCALFISCFCGVLCVYFALCTISLSLYSAIICVALTCILFGAILQFSVPATDGSIVASMLGEECGASAGSKVDGRCERRVSVVGHRACGLDAPENSLAALKKVIKEGILAVEFDVMLSHDDVPIVFHDETLTRMTNDDRKVSSLSYDELCTMDISVMHPFGKAYSGERIPTLNAFVECCIQNDVRMFIDLKCEGLELVPHIIKAFKEYPQLEKLAAITSFNPLLIYKIRARNPKITGCLGWRPYYCSYMEYSGLNGPQMPRSSNVIIHLWNRFLDGLHYWLVWHFLYYVVGLSIIFQHKDTITRDAIQHWRKRGVRVFAWSVNLPSEKTYFEKILQVPYLTDTVISS